MSIWNQLDMLENLQFKNNDQNYKEIGSLFTYLYSLYKLIS